MDQFSFFHLMPYPLLREPTSWPVPHHLFDPVLGDPARLHRNVGFRAVELRQIQWVVEENQRELLGAWNEYFHG